MRISDWSSDVCSSDLQGFARQLVGRGEYVGVVHGAGIGEQQADAQHETEVADAVDQERLHIGEDGRGTRDRKRVVEGKSVSVRVDLGGRRLIKKTTHTTARTQHVEDMNDVTNI